MYSSRILALLLALCISIITSLFLMLVESVTFNALLIVLLISFAVSYLLIFIVLEFLVFREINKIYRRVGKLKRKELTHLERSKAGKLNPLKSINDIYSFAERKQKEIDELKKMEAFRREFIADVSHELKTPIFAAQGFVHTLLDGAVKDKSVRKKFLRKAAKSLDGLDALVQDLLVLSHIETGQTKMHFEHINLRKITEEVFEQLEEKAKKQGLKLRIDAPSEKIRVYADWQRISQVMTNLVSNAIKHSENGDVVVVFEEGKKFITLHVKDFGLGIPAEHIARIFERFYRVDKSRSREYGGTGLGLAIVKHILEMHGSKAEVISAPGKGSDFFFKLPRHQSDMELQNAVAG